MGKDKSPPPPVLFPKSLSKPKEGNSSSSSSSSSPVLFEMASSSDGSSQQHGKRTSRSDRDDDYNDTGNGHRRPGGASLNDNGVCMINSCWREEQQPSLLHFISSFLHANSYRLNVLPIAPDFIFNNGGLSVAFNFLTAWDHHSLPTHFFSRVIKTKRLFQNFYAVVCLPTADHTDSFNRSFFKYGMEIGSPTIIPVWDPEMGFEKIVKIALARGVIKRQDIVSKMKIERDRGVQGMDMFLAVITSIPGIDTHDANMLIQAVGSIEAISKASKSFILENTDLSAEKAESTVRFFRDPEYYLRPKIN